MDRLPSELDSLRLSAQNTPPTTQDPQPQPRCNCLRQTADVLNRFPDFSNRSPIETYRIRLDDVLIIGEALTDNWETLKGCPVPDTHLDARMLQRMIDAARKMLMLYEATIESILGGWGQQPNGGGVDHDPSSTRNGSINSSVEATTAIVITEVPITVGAIQLDRLETTTMVNETLRLFTKQLGDMLRDIEEDMPIMDGANHLLGNDRVGEVRQLRSRVLRILQRVDCDINLIR